MKKIIVLAALCIATTHAFAQQQTLLDGDLQFGFFVGPAAKGTLLNSKACLMVGGSAGLILNQAFYLGGAGYRLLTNVSTTESGTDTTRLGFQYGGGLIGFQLTPDNLFHFGAQAIIGYGEVGYQDRNDGGHGHDSGIDLLGNDLHGPADGFFVVEPGVTAELNVSSHVRLNLEGSYRFISGVEATTVGVTNKSLGGPSATATLRIGFF